MKRELNILVEGWRDLPHSYSLVLSFQLLELLKRPQVRLWFRPVKYFNPTWRPLSPFSPAEQAQLNAIPAPRAESKIDVVYRAAYPFDFSPASNGAPVLVFATTEFRKLPDDCPCDFSRLQPDRVTITSPSKWSAAPFVEGGHAPVVLPHGVDGTKFFALPEPKRQEARRALGLAPEHFVFAHIGTMTQNKGIVPLLGAVNALLPSHPQLRLVLKGLGNLYASRRNLEECVALLRLDETRRQQLLDRVRFFDTCLDFASLNQVYNAADCYVSPYFGEGFNLPVLEALACERPVLVTDGGATDDFVTEPLFHVPSRSRFIPTSGATILECAIAHVAAKMTAVMQERDRYRVAAAQLGTQVRATYSWTRVVDQLGTILGALAAHTH